MTTPRMKKLFVGAFALLVVAALSISVITVSASSEHSDATSSAALLSPAAVMAGMMVNSTADTIANDGQCTLREAITNANNDNQSGSADCAAGSGTGTILKDDGPPSVGDIVISEFRFEGPTFGEAGSLNDFVEVQNVSNKTLDLSGLKLRIDFNGTQFADVTINNGTLLLPGQHFLAANERAFSLGGAVPPDQKFQANVNHGVQLTLADNTVLDQVGRTTSTIAGEGTRLSVVFSEEVENSYVRKLNSGQPQDTNDNAADFVLVSTTGVLGGQPAALGAPGPENLSSPIQRNAVVKSSLVDPTVASNAPPNRVRSGIIEPGVPNAFGTLSIQRKFTNTLAVPVTRLRFRVVDITTLNNRPPGHADLRVLSSTGVVRNSAGTIVRTVNGLTLEEPPQQPNGGGLNSSLTVSLPGDMLAPGNSIEVQFLLGVQEQGNFSFFINVEALPATPPAPAANGNTTRGAQRKQSTSNAKRKP